MAARRPILLNHSESLRPPQLPFCKQAAPRTYSESTLNTYKKHRGRRPHLLSIANAPLCFLTLTKCKFSNSFVLISIQNAGGVPSPSWGFSRYMSGGGRVREVRGDEGKWGELLLL